MKSVALLGCVQSACMTERERYLELMVRKAQRADPVERVVTLLTIELAGGVDTGIRFSIAPNHLQRT
jgi:hypothetical protein